MRRKQLAISFKVQAKRIKEKIERRKKEMNTSIPLCTGTSAKHNIRLSENFYLEEFVTSQVAERFGYRNQPNEKQIENLHLLCKHVLQPLRELIAIPIFISSGFRAFDVNYAVGGKVNSQHLEGKAADFTVPGKDLKEVFEMIPKHFSFDQLIYEFEKWIHVSWNGERNRNEVLISKKIYGKTVYENVKGET